MDAKVLLPDRTFDQLKCLFEVFRINFQGAGWYSIVVQSGLDLAVDFQSGLDASSRNAASPHLDHGLGQVNETDLTNVQEAQHQFEIGADGIVEGEIAKLLVD